MRKLFMVAAMALTAWSANSFAWSWIPFPADYWEQDKVKLGETFLMNTRDADYISMSGGRACGLSAFKIGVRGDDASIEDLKVVFGNGEVQDISVRQRFARGTDSRWVDLRGDTRCIQGVYVYGKSRTATPRESKVVFFGIKERGVPGFPGDIDFGATKLGATALMNIPDADFIDLRGANCGLKAFKIAVRGDAARIEYLAIKFQNGEVQNINVREFFAPGTSSNWKDLNGNRRCIDKVFIYGQSSSGRPRQSIVEFWGKY